MDKYVLDKALLIYRTNRNYNIHYFFQEHRIGIKDGKPVFLEGKPLTREAIIDLCRQITPTLKGEMAYINNNIIAVSGMSFGPDVWWVPPKRRVMFFTKDTGIPSKKVPWPGLVLVASKGKLGIFAVKGNTKPTPKSGLYVAPLFNMQSGSSICLGNSPTPKRNNDYESWEKALFESAFSQDMEDRRIKKGKLIDFFKELPFKRSFPHEMLIPCISPKNVGELLQQLNGGGYEQ